jgi:hypothetical protein
MYDILFEKYMSDSLSMQEYHDWNIIMKDVKMQERCRNDIKNWYTKKMYEIMQYMLT